MLFKAQSPCNLLLASLAIGFCFTMAHAQDAQPAAERKTGSVLQGSAIRRVEPAYPPLAKAARISGSVVVEVTVDEEGSVIGARTLSGHPLLKEAAVTAARGWKFKQTTLDGRPVKVLGTITFNFKSDNSEEIAELVKQIADNPTSAELHQRLGVAYLENAEPDKAIEPLNQAIRLDPEFAKAYLALGDAYSRTTTAELGIQAYRDAIRIKPDFAEAHLNLGMLFSREERHQEALEEFKRATTANDRMYLAYIGMGRSLKSMGRFHDALESFKQATEIEPESIDAHLELGETYSKLGDKESAVAEYEIIKKIAPGFAPRMLERIKKEK